MPEHTKDVLPAITTVVALDNHTERQLRGVWPTWRLHKRELLARPMIALCDYAIGDDRVWRHRLKWLDHPNLHLFSWDWWIDGRRVDGRSTRGYKQPATVPDGMTQRERMLTAFVHLAPQVVETPYWCKIDTDVVATNSEPWIDPAWFASQPALIASPWGYTKPAHWPGTLDRWGDGIEDLRRHPGLGLPEPKPDQQTIRHKRIASWVCLVNTIWSRYASSLSPGRLPVPSQDTYHHYVATRLGSGIVTARMSRRGWRTVSSDRRRARLVEEVLAAARGIGKPEEECCG